MRVKSHPYQLLPIMTFNFKVTGSHYVDMIQKKTIKAMLFKIYHSVSEGKISPVSTFGNHDLKFQCCGGSLCVKPCEQDSEKK